MSCVSIVIPVHDRAGLVAAAIGSVQAQEGIEAEIIVVDDGSTDGTAAAVLEIARRDGRVKLLRTSRRGPAAARNAGVAEAAGDFLCFVDSDDLCPPGRIARQAGKLALRPDVVAVVGAILRFDSLDETGSPRPDPRHRPYHDAALHTAMFRTGQFRGYGRLDETLGFAEDVDLFLRLLEADATLLLEPEVASFYRDHPGNMSRDLKARQQGYVQAYARSIARRRAAGRRIALTSFFPAIYEQERVVGGGAGAARPKPPGP